MNLRQYSVEQNIPFLELAADEPAPVGDHVFIIQWLHIPTGKFGLRRYAVCGDEYSMLILVNHWNKMGDAWKYTLME